MVEAIRLAFQNYVNFTGRARPSHFWWFALFTFLSVVVLSFVDAILGLGTSRTYSQSDGISYNYGFSNSGGVLTGLFALATFIPSLALGFRRLHDSDRSAWWLLIGLVPFFGSIVLLVFYILPGTVGPNRYGPDPKNPDGDLDTVFR
ncbi:MAG: DUF805 domain-containing protein [Sphingomonas sp.]|jgi:uncharacterized membrane protein YhaH (DUF805 family)|nr:DUF805 domain-containing protein [Sphingomonas sp.]